MTSGGSNVKVYLDFRDWWIGYYRGPNHHYVCPIPCVVLRWSRYRDQCGDVLESGNIFEVCSLPLGHSFSHESENATWGAEVPA